MRTAFIIIGLVVGMFVVIEAVLLGRLWLSLGQYPKYWQLQRQQTGDVTYVALGDSAAQGIGATSPDKGYVGLVAQEIERRNGKKVRIVNLSVSGAKINDVLETQLPQLAQYRPDFITIEIGANDVVAYDEEKFRQQFTALVQLLPEGTVVANMPYFGGNIKRDNEVNSANEIIRKAVDSRGLVLADLYTQTKVNNGFRVYAADLFHPSDRGYRNWAQAFIEKL